MFSVKSWMNLFFILCLHCLLTNSQYALPRCLVTLPCIFHFKIQCLCPNAFNCSNAGAFETKSVLSHLKTLLCKLEITGQKQCWCNNFLFQLSYQLHKRRVTLFLCKMCTLMLHLPNIAVQIMSWSISWPEWEVELMRSCLFIDLSLKYWKQVCECCSLQLIK